MKKRYYLPVWTLWLMEKASKGLMLATIPCIMLAKDWAFTTLMAGACLWVVGFKECLALRIMQMERKNG